MEKELSPRDTSLYKFWERTKHSGKGIHVHATPDEWNEQVYYLSQSGIGTEEVLKYLYTEQPAYDSFLDWLQRKHQSSEAIEHTANENVLSQEDLDSWDRDGYLVLKNAASAEQCAAARAAIWEFLGTDPLVPESWYELNTGKNGMMLSFFQHRALHTIRTLPMIRKAYEELYAGTEIYLLVDKVSFNPPETAFHKFNGSPLHLDVSLHPPVPFVLQGLLYLNDVGPSDGAFHCVPGFHKIIDTWIADLPEDRDPRKAILEDLTPILVPGNTGDLVIWHQALPHCATPNKGLTPRMVQYIAYKPVRVSESPIWK